MLFSDANNRSKLIIMLIPLMVIMLMFLSSCTTQEPSQKTEPPNVNTDNSIDNENEMAFQGNDLLTGKTLSYPIDYEGKAVYLIFFSITCPPCRENLPKTQTDETILNDEGIEIIVIASGDENSVKKFWQDNNITMKTILDKDNSINRAYEIMAFPTYFFINREGEIIDKTHVTYSAERIIDKLS